MEAIFEISRTYDVYIVALLLSLPRLYAFLDISQLLNSSLVPALPRTATILVLTAIAVPINLEYAAAFDRSALSFFLYFAKEYAIGFLCGYVVSWVFWVVQAAGGMIDSQRGASIASSIDPLQGQETSPLGNLFSQAFLTYVFSTGGFLIVLGTLYNSYVIWPASKAVPVIVDAFPVMILSVFDNAMRLAFVLAAPILAIMFLAEFALAMISRFSPQVQVFVLAMPIKSALAVMVLIIYFPSLFPFANQQLFGAGKYVEQLYGIMRAAESIKRPAFVPPPAQQGAPK
jgi:type III secretion protein T